MNSYVWQIPRWQESLRWDSGHLLGPLANARRKQGEFLARVAGLGFELGREVHAAVLTEETVTTAGIEGEIYDRDSVRSSVARKLGLPTAGLPSVRRDADGLVQVLFDATLKCEEPLTAKRLFGWQAALFPTGYSGLVPIEVGKWRTGEEAMRVVSGPVGRETVHYEAPPSGVVPFEMERFLSWWNSSTGDEGFIRAALAHLRFVTIHPFEDGNGRIARAIAESALARDEGGGLRFYSFSSQIQVEREGYYDVLMRSQAGDGDVTEWLVWFLECLSRAITRAETQLEAVFKKASFWQRHPGAGLSKRQLKALNRLLDLGPGGFEGGLTTRKYISMTRASRATAQRELAYLLEKGYLVKRPGGGRSTSYEPSW